MSPDDLTPQECAILLGLVREGVKKERRSRARGIRRWGDAYGHEAVDRRIEVLQGLYVRLGGDARRVSDSEKVRDDAHS